MVGREHLGANADEIVTTIVVMKKVLAKATTGPLMNVRGDVWVDGSGPQHAHPVRQAPCADFCADIAKTIAAAI